MSKLVHNTLNQKVYVRLRKMITDGELAVGSQIEERVVAKKMGVSRTPLREAISQLHKEGIIEYRPYRGNYVRAFTTKEVSDLYQVRIALETLAIRLAIPKLSQEHIEHIQGILNDVQDALDRDDVAGYSEADHRFHKFVVEITGNATLLELLDQLSAQIQIMRNMANHDPKVVLRTSIERPKILAALQARNADLAAELMAVHIEGVRQALVSQIERMKQELP